MAVPREIVCCVELGHAQVVQHLSPIAALEGVERIWIVRSRPLQGRSLDKAELVLVPQTPRPLRFAAMVRTCRKLARRPAVGAFVSFNPFPYGVLSLAAALPHSVPVHFGFIGTDVKRVESLFAPLLLPWVQRAHWVTCPGTAIAQRLRQSGVNEQQIAVLPHTVALDEFPVAESAPTYDVVFVGRLVPGKRVDIILRAIEVIRRRRPNVRLCVVGTGPSETRLRKLAGSLNVGEQVDFVGYQDNVYPFLAQSKIVAIASEHEGLPFSLVEAMASGLVPVATPVGAIAERIRHQENGYLVPPGDADALARAILLLLENAALYQRLRKTIIAERDNLGHSRATALWRTWLERLPA